jgi:ferric-dicitrate binding protein FerR (iron transport regulator)
MSAPHHARRLRRALSDLELSTPTQPTTAEARSESIVRIEEAIRAKTRRRRASGAKAFVAVAAVAAVLGIVVGVRRLPRARVAAFPPPQSTGTPTQVVARPVGDGSSVVVSTGQSPLETARVLSGGSRVVTRPGGRALLDFSTGTNVLLGEGTDATVDAEGATQVVRVDRGTIDLRVAKLATDQRFLVQTPDAQVEVRGTQFRVSVVDSDPLCGAATRTRVSVSEGVVVVRRGAGEIRLTPGQQWPVGCDRTSAGAGSREEPAVSGAPRSSVSASSGLAPNTPKLSQQNELFGRAVDAKRRGDTAAAVAAFERLITNYPNGPLAESAALERMRLLRTADPALAAVAARQYLARYPNGSNRAEAQAILAEAR